MKVRGRRRRKIKTVLFSALITVSLLITYQSLTNLLIDDTSQLINTPVATTENLKDIPRAEELRSFQGEKVIHVDLKGAPPLITYFEKFFPYIRKLGATGVLIEYEDMFPYKDELENIRARNAYQSEALKTMLKLAEENDLMVIPSIQTLGNLEFILKLKEFKHLREISDYPEMLCPTNEKAFALVKEMIHQVLRAHPKAKYIHIGCGEVRYLGRCGRCKNVMTKKKWTRIELYLTYLRDVILYINETYPGVRPIVWGDILIRLNEPTLTKSQIYTQADIMISIHSPKVTDYLTGKILLHIRLFRSIWIASAYKGSTGSNQMVTEVNHHLKNHISWMGIVDKWKELINFKGILLTGRQRYNHFSELCELLPVALPSLTVNLIYLNDTYSIKNNLSDKFSSADCYSSAPDCSFPGFKIYRIIRKFETLYKSMKTCFSLTETGQFTVYNILHKFISPAMVKYIFQVVLLEEKLSDLIVLEDEIKVNLLEVYDHHTVEEWVQTYVQPARIKLEALMHIKEILLEEDTWPRRPFPVEEQKLTEGAKKICDRKLDCIFLFI